MSKQYLTTHTLDAAHPTDIFSLAVTPTQIISASGSSSLQIHSTTTLDFPHVQTLPKAHKLGCHHVATSANGKKAASVGFEGQVKVWAVDEKNETWGLEAELVDGVTAGEVWAIALSEDGRYLASTTYNGRINVWDTIAGDGGKKIREYETKKSFGLAIDLSVNGRYTASGHESGAVYIFSNDSGRLLHSLPTLVKTVRAVSFSPGSTLLAAAGDTGIIALYDVSSGEQVAILTGHNSWIFSLSWSFTGEYLLSGSFNGKVKVWSVEQRMCVATHSETDRTVWCVRWMPKTGRNEGFAAAGAGGGISFYREATGG